MRLKTDKTLFMHCVKLQTSKYYKFEKGETMKLLYDLKIRTKLFILVSLMLITIIGVGAIGYSTTKE